MLHTNTINSSQQFYPCVMHRQKDEDFISRMTFLILFLGVLEQFNPPPSQQLCLLCGTSWHPDSWWQSLIKNVGCTCSRSVGVFKLRVDACEHFTTFITASTLLLNMTMWRCLSMHFTSKLSRETQMVCKNTTYQALDFPTWKFAFPFQK